MNAPTPFRPMPAGNGIPIDEEELQRWRLRLLERGYKETTALLWISRVRTACAHGVADEAEVDVVFPTFTSGTRSGLRQALRELDEFRRSA